MPGKGVKVTRDGPYLVTGSVPLSTEMIGVDDEGYAFGWKKGRAYPKKEAYSLCRCGQSGSKPYCDSTHLRIKYKGKETASRVPFLKQSSRTEGPALMLRDAPRLCASAGFCHRKEGTWSFTRRSNNPQARKEAIQQACDCPSGRLVIYDRKTGKAIEPAFKQSISVVEDPGAGVAGPLWIKGGVPVVSSDGKAYEIRNRVTLCRCGRSRNRPFCDGSHMRGDPGHKD